MTSSPKHWSSVQILITNEIKCRIYVVQIKVIKEKKKKIKGDPVQHFYSCCLSLEKALALCVAPVAFSAYMKEPNLNFLWHIQTKFEHLYSFSHCDGKLE